MCLDKVFKNDGSWDEITTEYVGYKVLSNIHKAFGQQRYRGIIFMDACMPYELGKWYIASGCNTLLQTDTGNDEYRQGFHIFRTVVSARKYAELNWVKDKDNVIVKVKYKNILAKGYDYVEDKNTKNRVDVAREMKLVEEVG